MKEHFNIFPLLSRYSALRRKYLYYARTGRDFPEQDMKEIREIDERLTEEYPLWTESESEPSQTPQGDEEP